VDARPDRAFSGITRSLPFTLSHPAALALLWPVGRRLSVPFSALAIGAMSPDFEFFIHLSPRALLSHTFLGLFVFCVPVGLSVLACWESLARDPVRALLGMEPEHAPVVRSATWWTTAAFGVFVGAASHLVWDGVTHGSYWGAELWPWLRSPAFNLGGATVPWFNALQHFSTIVGGLVVVAWGVVTVHRDGDLASLWTTGWRLRALAMICASAVLVAVANGSRGPFGADFWTLQRLLGRIAVGGLLGIGLGVAAFALTYRRQMGAT
jgi:hypothetical protein